MEKIDKEHLSALFDSEILIDEKSMSNVLSQDNDVQAKLERYSLIRGAMKEEVLVEEGEFLSKVKLVLENEPVVLAPVRKNNKTYFTLGLAASFLLFTVLVLTFSLNESADSGFEPMAQAEQDDEASIVYTQTPSTTTNVVVQPKARLATFGK